MGFPKIGIVVGGMAACAGIAATLAPARAADIMETLRSSGQFGRAAELIEQAGLADTLRGPGPFTVFAPLDSAFAPENGPPGRLLDPAEPGTLRAVIAYHIVPDARLTGDDLHNGVVNEYPTLNGMPMVVHDTRHGVMIRDAVVKRVDVEADNGIIQGISRVIIPPGG